VRHHRRVRGDGPALARCARALAAIVEDAGPVVFDRDQVRLAIHECLLNALEHGHGGDVARAIEVEVTGAVHEVTVSIRDGADLARTPRAPARRRATTPGGRPAEQERGRGLVLAAASCAALELRQHPDGTTAVLRWPRVVSVRSGPEGIAASAAGDGDEPR
jgi:anti-sigma regulatory factor (Ser/Thr protein kinase)